MTNNEELVKLRYICKAHHCIVNESYLRKVLLISRKIYDAALSGRDPEGNYICSRISVICEQKTDMHRKRMEERIPKCETWLLKGTELFILLFVIHSCL